MRFLITNDDGVNAPGILLLAAAAAEFGEVITVAPATEQSGISHRVTFDRPLRAWQSAPEIHTVDGTPADCVRFALTQLGDFDGVLSGVNDGANLGVDIFYSGTVAAAREATFFGVPAIAVSQYRRKYSEPFDWHQQQSLVQRVLSEILDHVLTSANLVNVNLPDPLPVSRFGVRGEQNSAEIALVECEVDTSPFPPGFQMTGDGLVTTTGYSGRPRIHGRDIDVCLSGNASVSYLRF